MRPARWWPLAAAAGAAFLATASAAGAQPEPPPRIDLVTQTTIVGDEPATFVLEISEAPENARLQVCINAPLTDRDDLREARDDPPRVCRVANYTIAALAELAVPGEPGRYSVVVPDEEVGLFLRRDAGALPVVIELIDESGIIDTLVTQLLVVRPPADGPSTVHLSLISALGAPLAHQPDGSVVSTADELGAGLAALQRLPRDAVAVALRPESLAAVGTAGDTVDLDQLVQGLSSHEVLLEPWVGIDEEGWRLAGEADMVLAQYAEGRSTIEELANKPPTGIVRLDTDANDATLGLLRSAGATEALVDARALDAPALESADYQPVHVRDDNGVPMRALTIDDRLAETLADADPELAAHRALAELILVSGAAAGDRAIVVDIDTGEHEALGRLLELMADREQLRTSTLTAVFELPLARTSTGGIVEARLQGEDPPFLGDAAEVQRFARAAIDAYQGMVTSEAPIVPLRTLLSTSVDDRLDDEARAEYTTAVIAAVTQGTSGITIVESERITLATRTADLPVTIRNEQPLPVTVDLVLRAEKLRFPEGDQRTIELRPGDNSLTVRVEARASGDARVTATLHSPDGRLDLDEAVIPIRSTALSGIGLLISALALSVLLVWWIRTVRRTRRDRSAATVPASAGDQADVAQGNPGDEGSMEEA